MSDFIYWLSVIIIMVNAIHCWPRHRDIKTFLFDCVVAFLPIVNFVFALIFVVNYFKSRK